MGSEQMNRGSRSVEAGTIDQRLVEGAQAQAQAQASVLGFGTGMGRFQMGQQPGQGRVYEDGMQGESEGMGEMELDAFGEFYCLENSWMMLIGLATRPRVTRSDG